MSKFMNTRVRWVIGNWKMNGNLGSNASLLESLLAGMHTTPNPRARMGVCAPSPYFNQLQRTLGASDVRYGAQDVSEHLSGAYTGQTSAAMLVEFGVKLALVGHSERRLYNAETSEEVARKATAAFAAGVTPVICVGEALVEREAGAAQSVVAGQIEACAQIVQTAGAELIFAYEPVWAIGTGKTATPAQAQEMHAFIRAELASYAPNAIDTPILYGGSVKANNAVELFAQKDIDGGLIGGASLVAADFLSIYAAA
jgi:triosephosphate isomerase (TIM)